jgi:probable rRNA maturation factor
MKNIDIIVQIDCTAWENWYTDVEWSSFFTTLSQNVMEYFSIEQPLEISVVLSDDGYVQDLNSTYRSKAESTNVLSFPQSYIDDIQQDDPTEVVLLGDIVMSYTTIQTEVKDQQKLFMDHVTHLFIHSILHLLGFDHVEDTAAEEMEALEVLLLKKMNIQNPYQ